MDLIRDLLDKPVADRNRQEMGRVDGIVIAIAAGEHPRVVAIEIGPSVLADRFHPLLGSVVALIERWLGLGTNRPTRIPVDHIKKVSEKIVVDVAASEVGATNVEHAVRKLLGGR